MDPPFVDYIRLSVGRFLTVTQRRVIMTPLRARFIAHLHLKGYSDTTQKNYLGPLIQFSRHLKARSL